MRLQKSHSYLIGYKGQLLKAQQTKISNNTWEGYTLKFTSAQ
ncbi:hypothetical protein JOC48_000498 [Aquibacillus albus]|uniref:Uncharacterized protein n=1 Tax=Aquibacillus albus TaxID=1168171 RepID=A0ABS2MVV7_9BACI|nr:hypothetical protein [Aquibacillus albus]